MLDFINEFGGSVLAGLIPSLLVFAQGMYLQIKNLKVNSNFTILEGQVKELLKGNLNVEKVVNSTVNVIKDVQEDFKKEIIPLIEEIKKNYLIEIEALESKLKLKFKEDLKVALDEVKRGVSDVSEVW